MQAPDSRVCSIFTPGSLAEDGLNLVELQTDTLYNFAHLAPAEGNWVLAILGDCPPRGGGTSSTEAGPMGFP